jgi:serine/threonine protein kinase/tetratricopeptide (TPR) repeat protein
MRAERWRRIEELCQAALEQPPEKRAAFLAAACPDDGQLRAEVESLLAQQADSFLESAPVSTIHALSAGAKLGNFEVVELLGRGGMGEVGLARRTRFGPYEIVSLIGAGGMGEVYRARDTRLDRDVAIKVLNERLACDPASLMRFQTEAKSIAAMSHPNILSIFDAELQHPPFFIVTELLEGETVRQLIRHSPLHWRRTLEIGAAVADGLAVAHAAGIVHRDLKPENLFLTKRGGVKILDFGLARFKRDSGSEPGSLAPTLSDAGLVMGTVGYLAPEQARGEAVTAATDIFSFGCVLYEMVSGRRAFHRSTPASTLAAILNDNPRSVTEFVEDIPPELDRWLTRCLIKEREARPQSVRDLGLVLRDLLGEREHSTRSQNRDAGAEGESVAVLPFFTSTSSPDAEYLADGITESLINNLAQLSHLRVVARSTVFRHKGKDVDPIEVGRELGVKAVLTGRIFQRGDVLVIAAELVNVRDGLQLWGQQYKRQLTDIFAIEEEISREISGRLRVRFTAEEQSRLTRRYTESPGAYQLYLKGRYFWNERTIEGMRQALSYFEQAVETDPSYARAYTGLADCISMLAIYGALDARQGFPKAKAAQAHALQIDPKLAEAHASRGFSLLLFDWRFREAEDSFRRALELSAGYPSAYQWLGFTLGLTQRLDEARSAMKLAQELDPFSSSINTTAVWPVYWAGLFDEAIEGFRAAAELHPGYWVAHYYLGLSYAQKGDYGRSLLALRHAAEIGDSLWRYQGLGFVYAQGGEPRQANEVLAKLHEIGHRQYVPPIYFAAVHAGLGETDLALEYLERAAMEHNWQIAWLHVDPFWDSLRGHPRLQKLQQELGLPV